MEQTTYMCKLEDENKALQQRVDNLYTRSKHWFFKYRGTLEHELQEFKDEYKSLREKYDDLHAKYVNLENSVQPKNAASKRDLSKFEAELDKIANGINPYIVFKN